MPDNVGITPGTGATAAADEIDGVLHQRVKITVGSDGVSRGDVDVTNPMPVREDDLRSIEQAAEQLKTAQIPTGNDEPLQLVGLHPNFPLPIDTATPMPIAGRDSTGAQRQIATDAAGRIVPTDCAGPFLLDFTAPANTIFYVADSLGYNSMIVNLLSGSVTIYVSTGPTPDYVEGAVPPAWVVNSGGRGTAAFTTNGGVPVGETIIPMVNRYVKLRTATTAGRVQGFITFRNLNPLPFLGAVAGSVNLTQVNSVAVSNASGQFGVNAFGPTAAGVAHGANNPVQIAGSDGTIGRRILTDTAGNTTVVGHVTTGATLIPATSDRGPVLVGAADLERRAQRMVVDGLGRLRIQNEESGTKDDGVIDALNNVVRELRLMNARLADLPYYLGVNAVMPDDSNAFRDDSTLFNR
jgi:hypothetical protein